MEIGGNFDFMISFSQLSPTNKKKCKLSGFVLVLGYHKPLPQYYKLLKGQKSCT